MRCTKLCSAFWDSGGNTVATVRALFGVLMVSAIAINLRAADDLALPNGVKAVWDMDKAWHETTPTRERVCLNGLWAWQPGKADTEAPPAGNWGGFKVPGAWPGRGD